MESNKHSLKQVVYEKIKELILTQEVKPGEILNERRLSEKLNVSRTPIREALKSLEKDDLVHYKPYVGAIVNEINQEDFKHIFQVRQSLELLAAEIAYDKMNNETIRKLESCMHEQDLLAKSAEANMADFIKLDMDFHNIIVNVTGNNILRQFLWELRDKTYTLGINALKTGETRYIQTIQEHRNIVTAYKKNDLELIRVTMNEHIYNTYLNARKYLESRGK